MTDDDALKVTKEQVKYRVIGTTALLALAVIFLPDILDGKKQQVEEVYVEIPLRPKIETPKALPQQPLIVESTATETPVIETPVEPAAPIAETSPTAVVSTPAEDLTEFLNQLELAEQLSEQELQEQQNKAKEIAAAQAAAEAAKAAKVAEELELAARQKAQAEKELQAIAPVSTKPDPQIKAGWTLQLGSFRDAKNVGVLVAQLRAGGFKTYTIPEMPVSGRLTKVFVGPDLSKEKLDKMKPLLAELTKLQGHVIRYESLEQ